MNICIIGSGFVGTQIGAMYSKIGHKVTFYDIDEKILINLAKKGFNVSSEFTKAVKSSDVAFICVPTPTNKSGEQVLDSLIKVVKQYGRFLKTNKNTTNHILIIKSTILPGTTENIVIPLLEKYSKKKSNEDFGVIYSPEFLTEISNTWTDDDTFNITAYNEGRVILGEGQNKYYGNILVKEIFNKIKDTKIIRTNYKTAEMIKYVSNCYAATRISFFNQIFLICNKIGIDSQFVANVIGMDPRFGKYGIVHGKAFGGKCLPKDLKAFVKFAERYADVDLLKSVDKINELMKKEFGVRE